MTQPVWSDRERRAWAIVFVLAMLLQAFAL